jgi:hypothetical protein
VAVLLAHGLRSDRAVAETRGEIGHRSRDRFWVARGTSVSLSDVHAANVANAGDFSKISSHTGVRI